VNFRLTKRGVTVAAIALTVLVVFIGVALAATSSPRFCAACKSHVPYVDEYNRSAHRDVNCEQCHTKPGPFFFLTSKLEALQQPIAQLTGDYEKPILGFVLNQSCRRCHTNDDLFKPISSSGIRVDHQHLIEAGFLCQRCHSTTAHGDAIPEGSRTYPVMEQCLICHNNECTAQDGTVATSR
jgi:nitrate/TMAO reductase-like tetraheme cytochrome c subunit